MRDFSNLVFHISANKTRTNFSCHEIHDFSGDSTHSVSLIITKITALAHLLYPIPLT